LDGTEEDYEDVGRRLKKNNVSIDVINFAHPDNVSRLQTLVQAANQGSEDSPSCHFLDCPEGVTHITDVLITSPILQSEEMMQAQADGGAAGGEFAGLGIDPNADPELAMALRLSMEEARANEAAAGGEPAQNQEAAGAGAANPGTQPGLNAANQDNDDMYSDDDGQDEDAAL
jgi:26S proteasome regulatory subunit N10